MESGGSWRVQSGGSSEPDARTHPQSCSEELRDFGRGAQHPRLHSSAALVALACCEADRQRSQCGRISTGGSKQTALMLRLPLRASQVPALSKTLSDSAPLSAQLG
ncbi:unnamed protein product [Pleuronectes platessa]|uniref:Uncharacterized protein n=1 Tax=Pleuronectes platessa TaxID=8262 RepID=A0A9N7TLB3_PLEPL|nr:unnamed protein product [Pleuronectes platessa]